MGYYYGYAPYVPVAEKRRKAEARLARLRKNNASVSPVVLSGKKIAGSFWGKAWCENLERYRDYEYRLPRGRSYVRNGSVLDLKIRPGEITALVEGSETYKVNVKISAVPADKWKRVCQDCSGAVGSLVELLQGRLSSNVMERVCRKEEGLFPSPDEIRLSCSCPDWADMCKHVAAAMYGVGARLDEQPDLLFTLRGADANDLIAGAGKSLLTSADSTRVLEDGDVAALFGLDMEEEALPPVPTAKKKTAKTRTGPPPEKAVSVKKTVPAGKKKQPEKSLPKKSRSPARVDMDRKTSAPAKKKRTRV